MRTYNFHYILFKQGSIVIFFFNVGEVRLTAPYKHFSITHTEQVRPPIQTILGPMWWARGTGPAAHPPFERCWGSSGAEEWASCILHTDPCSAAHRTPSGNTFAFMAFIRYTYGFYRQPSWTKIISSFLFSPGKGNLSFFSNESFELH